MRNDNGCAGTNGECAGANTPTDMQFAGLTGALTQFSAAVVVCCHNSRSRLPSTLKALSLTEQRLSVEVVLVDNASTDGTGEYAAEVWRELGVPFPLRVVAEPNPGLSNARRRGVFAAQNDIVIFCDDDNLLDPDYISIAVSTFADPTVGAVGGQATPIFESQDVDNAVYSHGHWLALGVQALGSADVTNERGYLWGAGLAAPRSLLSLIYSCPTFPVMLGRSGKALSSGDDSELCWALRVLGKRLVYREELRLSHRIPSARTQLSYFQGLRAADGWSGHIRSFADAIETTRGQRWMRSAAGSVVRLVRGRRDAATRRHYRNLLLAALDRSRNMDSPERELYLTYVWLKAELNNSAEFKHDPNWP